MVIYKVSPPRENLVFEPSVFYRTAEFRSSSTRSKPGYIQDTLLYAGDERDISLHLFPNIYRVRVWLDEAKRQHKAACALRSGAPKPTGHSKPHNCEK
jgi:hypothetical protein